MTAFPTPMSFPKCSPADPVPPFGMNMVSSPDDATRRDEADPNPMDQIDEASMESFPCSDPPSYTRCHA